MAHIAFRSLNPGNGTETRLCSFSLCIDFLLSAH
jgi:hypothetical protein